MIREIRTPELCRTCYWRLSGCLWGNAPGNCVYYEPEGFDNDPEPQPDHDYDPGPDADAWGRNGFMVFDSARDMAMYYKEDDA